MTISLAKPDTSFRHETPVFEQSPADQAVLRDPELLLARQYGKRLPRRTTNRAVRIISVNAALSINATGRVRRHSQMDARRRGKHIETF